MLEPRTRRELSRVRVVGGEGGGGGVLSLECNGNGHRASNKRYARLKVVNLATSSCSH